MMSNNIYFGRGFDLAKEINNYLRLKIRVVCVLCREFLKSLRRTF